MYLQVEIAPGAEPERLEDAVGATVREELVAKTAGLARMLHTLRVSVIEGVTVSFAIVVIVKGLRVSEPDLGALTAGDGEDRVASGESLAVKQDVQMSVGGNRDGVFRKRHHTGLFGCGWLDADGVARADGLVGHVRQRVRHQAPGIVTRCIGGVGAVHIAVNAVAHG